MRVDDELRDRIRQQREALGLSQAKLADMAGTSQQTLDRIERGAVKFSRTVPALLTALNIDHRHTAHIHESFVAPKLRASDISRLSFGEKNENSPDIMPIYDSHSAEFGYYLGEVIQWTKRPDSLVNVINAYGILVIDDEMAPAFRRGDIALVHPFKPPQKGSDVLIHGTIQVDREPRQVCILRYLADFNLRDWTAVQWHHDDPDDPERVRESVLSRDLWPVCHVVVARLSGR